MKDAIGAGIANASLTRRSELFQASKGYRMSMTLHRGRKGRMIRWWPASCRRNQAAASFNWAAANGIVFDHGKTRAALFHRKRTVPTASIMVGNQDVPLNKEATRWLGIWLDSHLTPNEHHATRLKKARNAMDRLRRLTGQMASRQSTGGRW